jgi:hypothetical protein
MRLDTKDRFAEMFQDVMQEAMQLRAAAQTATESLQNEVKKFELTSRHATSKIEDAVVGLPSTVENAVKAQLAAPAAEVSELMIQRLHAAQCAAERAVSVYSTAIGNWVTAIVFAFLIGLGGGLFLGFKLWR